MVKTFSAKLQNTPQLWSASLTCVGRLWRSRHNTIHAILIQWHVNELRGILKLLHVFCSVVNSKRGLSNNFQEIKKRKSAIINRSEVEEMDSIKLEYIKYFQTFFMQYCPPPLNLGFTKVTDREENSVTTIYSQFHFAPFCDCVTHRKPMSVRMLIFAFPFLARHCLKLLRLLKCRHVATPSSLVVLVVPARPVEKVNA